MDDLLEIAEKVAQQEYDGHMTLLWFTTGWKVFFRTINVDDGSGREFLLRQPSFSTLEQALRHLLSEKPSVY